MRNLRRGLLQATDSETPIGNAILFALFVAAVVAFLGLFGIGCEAANPAYQGPVTSVLDGGDDSGLASRAPGKTCDVDARTDVHAEASAPVIEVSTPIVACAGGGHVVMATAAPLNVRCSTDLPGETCVAGVYHGYYEGLPCPFDVVLVVDPAWRGPCEDCLDGKIITNGGGSLTVAWRSTASVRYYCEGSSVCAAPR